MSYANPLKLVAGLIVELGGFGLILFGLPLLLGRLQSQDELANVGEAESAWTTNYHPANYHPAPPARFVPPPRSEMAELGRPRIMASQLRDPQASVELGVPYDPRLEPLPQEARVARTLDAAGQRLVNAVGGYLHQQADQVFVSPRGNGSEGTGNFR